MSTWMPSRARSRPVAAYVPGLSRAICGTGRSRIPECTEGIPRGAREAIVAGARLQRYYEPATPQLFECLTLGELLPDNPPETTATMRNALPELVQDRTNYRLIFAEEFEGGKSQSRHRVLHDRMATIMDSFNVVLDPCTNRDASSVPIPCEEI